MSYLLSELAEKFEVMSTGDGSTRIEGVCGLSDDKRNHLAFVSQRSFLASASASQISGFISHPDFPVPNKPNLVSENPQFNLSLKQRFNKASLGSSYNRQGFLAVTSRTLYP